MIPRQHSFEDETKQLGIDFDGVIHMNSRGFFDGTIYDEPVPGSIEAIKNLSRKYDIVIFSAKARDDRMLIDGKTGVELITEWLEKHNLLQYVKEVTAEKPRAVAYIDDKAITFTDWNSTFEKMEKMGI